MACFAGKHILVKFLRLVPRVGGRVIVREKGGVARATDYETAEVCKCLILHAVLSEVDWVVGENRRLWHQLSSWMRGHLLYTRALLKRLVLLTAEVHPQLYRYKRRRLP